MIGITVIENATLVATDGHHSSYTPKNEDDRVRFGINAPRGETVGWLCPTSVIAKVSYFTSVGPFQTSGALNIQPSSVAGQQFILEITGHDGGSIEIQWW